MVSNSSTCSVLKPFFSCSIRATCLLVFEFFFQAIHGDVIDVETRIHLGGTRLKMCCCSNGVVYHACVFVSVQFAPT